MDSKLVGYLLLVLKVKDTCPQHVLLGQRCNLHGKGRQTVLKTQSGVVLTPLSGDSEPGVDCNEVAQPITPQADRAPDEAISPSDASGVGGQDTWAVQELVLGDSHEAGPSAKVNGALGSPAKRKGFQRADGKAKQGSSKKARSGVAKSPGSAKKSKGKGSTSDLGSKAPSHSSEGLLQSIQSLASKERLFVPACVAEAADVADGAGRTTLVVVCMDVFVRMEIWEGRRDWRGGPGAVSVLSHLSCDWERRTRLLRRAEAAAEAEESRLAECQLAQTAELTAEPVGIGSRESEALTAKLEKVSRVSKGKWKVDGWGSGVNEVPPLNKAPGALVIREPGSNPPPNPALTHPSSAPLLLETLGTTPLTDDSLRNQVGGCQALGCTLHKAPPHEELERARFQEEKRARFNLPTLFRSLPSHLDDVDGILSRTTTAMLPAGASTCTGICDLPDEVLILIMDRLGPTELQRMEAVCQHTRALGAALFPSIRLPLFQHQRAAARWMIARERCPSTFPNPLFRCLTSEDGFTLHANLVTGEVSPEEPPPVVDGKGGLICDEPGMGKTATSLAVIMKTVGTHAMGPLQYPTWYCDFEGMADGQAGYYVLPGNAPIGFSGGSGGSANRSSRSRQSVFARFAPATPNDELPRGRLMSDLKAASEPMMGRGERDEKGELETVRRVLFSESGGNNESGGRKEGPVRVQGGSNALPRKGVLKSAAKRNGGPGGFRKWAPLPAFGPGGAVPGSGGRGPANLSPLEDEPCTPPRMGQPLKKESAKRQKRVRFKDGESDRDGPEERPPEKVPRREPAGVAFNGVDQGFKKEKFLDDLYEERGSRKRQGNRSENGVKGVRTRNDVFKGRLGKGQMAWRPNALDEGYKAVRSLDEVMLTEVERREAFTERDGLFEDDRSSGSDEVGVEATAILESGSNVEFDEGASQMVPDSPSIHRDAALEDVHTKQAKLDWEIASVERQLELFDGPDGQGPATRSGSFVGEGLDPKDDVSRGIEGAETRTTFEDPQVKDPTDGNERALGTPTRRKIRFRCRAVDVTLDEGEGREVNGGRRVSDAERDGLEALWGGTDVERDRFDNHGNGLDALESGPGALGIGLDALREGVDASGQDSDARERGLEALAIGSDALGNGPEATRKGPNALRECSDAPRKVLDDKIEPPTDSHWVECEACHKWRRLLPECPRPSPNMPWFCSMNKDALRSDCIAPSEVVLENEWAYSQPGFLAPGEAPGSPENVAYFLESLRAQLPALQASWRAARWLAELKPTDLDRLSFPPGIMVPYFRRDAGDRYKEVFRALGLEQCLRTGRKDPTPGVRGSAGRASKQAEAELARSPYWCYPRHIRDGWQFDTEALKSALATPVEEAKRIYLSKATLVVAPSNLIQHWLSQIRKHLPPGYLKVCVWDGNETKAPSAHKLAWQYDVVLTTFNRLSVEWANKGESTLMQVHWLRLMLDEGHTLGSSLQLTNKLQMAIALRADRRWVLTGTPTPTTPNSQVAHLHPLLKFLHEGCYGEQQRVWETAIQKPFEAQREEGRLRLEELLQRTMISATKEDMRTIPECHRKLVMLEFTPVHQQSYNELVSTVKRNLLLADWNDPNHVESLLNPRQWKLARDTMLNVRKSCCVAGNMMVEDTPKEIDETMELLDVVPPRSDQLRSALKSGGHCDRCGAWSRLPFITPCAHLLCIACVSSSGTHCPLGECYRPYKMQQKGRRPENPNPIGPVPQDLIELQPSYTQAQWAPDWQNTQSSKLSYLRRCLQEMVAANAALLAEPPLDSPLAGSPQDGSGQGAAPGDVSATGDDVDCAQRASWQTMQPATRAVEWPTGSGSNSGHTPTKRPEKAIVFSEFLEYLTVVEEQLAVAGIQSAAMYSPKTHAMKMQALRRFITTPTCCVLIMDASAAVGLDLSFVSRVYLMEPIWDKSLEEQVVSRAWRMGATRPVLVETLAMRGTIEEEMVEVLQNQEDYSGKTHRETQELNARISCLSRLKPVGLSKSA